VPAPIEGQLPGTWQDLETTVGRILTECGYDVEVQKNVKLARGDVDVDVWADDHSSPPNVIAVECKLWKAAVPKNVVHAFRQVVGDSGANTGLLVSAGGFQDGAVEAAAYSNVRLMDWDEFQAMFVTRWFQRFMAPELRKEADPLIEYTEPINTRIFRKADALEQHKQHRFKELREKYLPLSMGFLRLLVEPVISPQSTAGLAALELPLRRTMVDGYVAQFSDAVLDADALRALLEALTTAYRDAIAEIDEVFGGRA
jgi:hypothetical protein